MLTPTLEEFMALAEQGKRPAVRKRIPADLETPVSAFLKLKPRGAVFLLESVEQGIQMGRYSFIGISPYATIQLKEETLEIQKNGVTSKKPVDPSAPFAAIQEELTGSKVLVHEHLPGPFAGAVGFISYDMVRYFERVPMPKSGGLGLPDFHFFFPATLAVFDHVNCEIEILVLPPEGEPDQAYKAAKDQIETLLEALQTPLHIRNGSGQADRTPPVSNMEEEVFKQKVLQAKEHILAGDAFQIVLSQRLRGETSVPPFQIYRALRILNPSPYMFFMDMGEFQIIGSSPEVLVKLEGRKASLCPIAGTRPRGGTPAADQRFEKELLADEKERAEHVMLVDLQIEKYSHVMHIVSRLSGTLREDLDMFDLMRASFPAGTVTGAPKIRAMEIITDLEGEARGPYAGAVGYFGRQGDMDMCITIRTLIMRGKEYFAQAGAGLVADSDPASEYTETLNKIEAIIKAISIAEEGF
ncbi:MAG: anthranilate synthase component I family protein [Planctomycetota bacterium]|jgi:anthranilate synthase component 1